jgi:prepilin-type N-terminal cleavage/methylation domain-containing protein
MRRGFTLVEVVVAMAVWAITLAIIAVSLREVAGLESLSKVRVVEARRVEGLRRAVSADLRALTTLDGGVCFQTLESWAGGRRADWLVFARTGPMWRPSPAAPGPNGTDHAPFRVMYGCAEEMGGLTLFRTERAGDSGDSVAVPLLRGLCEFAVEGVYEDEPAAADAVPGLVKLTLRFNGGGVYEVVCGVLTHKPGGGKQE